ncbi:MAG: hypothetical protein JWN52_4703 [Actinomycetia bacterium]|jgi:hypothetical protein|nr:hypothetical protein [Actinomycetes bacterium]
MAKKVGDRVNIEVGGDVPGQIIVGHGNSVSGHAPGSLTSTEFAQLKELIDQARQALSTQPDAQTPAGLAKLDDLEEAITGDEPDLATMEHVHGWFGRKVPRLSDMVGRIILSPIVSRVVTAAGDDMIAEFQRRFGP